jgi:hypothetical protein
MIKKQRHKKGSFRQKQKQYKKWYNSISIQVRAAIVGGIFIILAAIIAAVITGMLASKTLRVILNEPRVETNVTLEKYLNRSNLSSDKYTTEQLLQIGYIVHFHVQIEGFKGRKCTVNWSMYDAESESKIDLLYPWAEVQKPINLTPEQALDSAAEFFWVPVLDKEGTFYVRVEVCDDRGARINFIDTKPIPFKPLLTH